MCKCRPSSAMYVSHLTFYASDVQLLHARSSVVGLRPRILAAPFRRSLASWSAPTHPRYAGVPFLRVSAVSLHRIFRCVPRASRSVPAPILRLGSPRARSHAPAHECFPAIDTAGGLPSSVPKSDRSSCRNSPRTCARSIAPASEYRPRARARPAREWETR